MKNKRTGRLLSLGSKFQNLIVRSIMEIGSYSLMSVRVDCYGHYHSTDDINYEWFYKVIIDDLKSGLNPALTYKEREEAECNVNGHIIGAVFSSGEWGIDSRLPVSLPQKFKIAIVNKHSTDSIIYSAGD
jgi:hypothetical protein